ncbi:MAG: thioredoxin domain-containing protein [Desulfuromonadaceae bacterium]|nr:thioredoxin domain-containing protein [Desulfuromonadaceae bacterium]MDD2849217.1 thioredoxin domain-containing protein [Desulfuromonadaceae bacterium]MDD4129734.1 thioredoxin domain-containing protein [Desulfuromonadaceae bacterium]
MNSSNDTAAYVASLMAIDKTTLSTEGDERFNRLIFARSPYLLQHAENPVKWYEWGADAFNRARSESLPILLSIGYATCHWCHVMAHESFEDLEVAALLNRHFVCIKVDREERPDVDDFYMAVSQTLTGSGGWPLNIFMTPDKRPFMAITYLPKRGRDGMSGLMELLANIATLWRQRPDLIENNCRGIMESLEEARRRQLNGSTPKIADVTEKALQTLKSIYDPQHGGFGTAPKFPMPIYLLWLMDQGQDGTPEATKMALHTLRQMRSGGIWDHLGGGLHRYSVDSSWLAPHFEKMLYDQAMLLQVATQAFLADKSPLYLIMCEEIISFVERELFSGGGAFCSALDADSEGVEGKFYLWDKGEIDACLDADAELFCRYHAVTDGGNFESHNILTAPLALDEFCRLHQLNLKDTEERLERCRIKLLEQREMRIRPLRDDKIITSWNGLMIGALATAGVVCSKAEYISRAARAASFILASLRRSDGRVLRSYLNGATDVPAFLEDYAFLAGGLLDLYAATLDQKWLREARHLAAELLRLFRDPDSGEFTLIGNDAEQMPTRVASDHDGVTPSALARTAQLLYRLAWIDNREELLDVARAALSGVAGELKRNPLGHLGALQILTLLEAEPTIATFSGETDTPETFALNAALHKRVIKGLVIRSDAGPGPSSLSLCMAGTCYPAVATPDELERFFQGKSPLAPLS